MKYWKITPILSYTYEYVTDNTVTKEEMKQWFKITHSRKYCKVKEVNKRDIDCMWVTHLIRKDNGLLSY